ncbi:hypothetical protein DRE_06537 [Drechslerella stenobrocha 248]|uniref:DUF7587 domain-containing protein n=1 Tax=Drechslerella stenobrocha 248 TaxID=1043628 RepID=W7HNN6_9PEZI|nr:hypothetical protein DRE_06537 [Drechslerella stenobrocha 248]
MATGDFPPYLYRVNLHGVSHTAWDELTGFQCSADGYVDIYDNNNLFNALKNHLNWNSGSPSHLISTFSDKLHAENWAWKQICNGRAETAQLMTIDPHRIVNRFGRPIPILDVLSFVQKRPKILPDFIDETSVEGEYVVFYKIPRDAVIRVQNVSVVNLLSEG